MVEGHMKGGKFIPHNNDSGGTISEPEVTHDTAEPELNMDNVEKLKNRKLAD